MHLRIKDLRHNIDPADVLLSHHTLCGANFRLDTQQKLESLWSCCWFLVTLIPSLRKKLTRQSVRCWRDQLFRCSVLNCGQSQKESFGSLMQKSAGSYWVLNIKCSRNTCLFECELLRPQRNYWHEYHRDAQNPQLVRIAVSGRCLLASV